MSTFNDIDYCVNPFCQAVIDENNPAVRGLCRRYCYTAATRIVAKKEATWEQLEALGRCLPKSYKNCGTRPGRGKKYDWWFSTDPSIMAIVEKKLAEKKGHDDTPKDTVQLHGNDAGRSAKVP